MRFLVLTLGTRGDLELFRTLALALQARGHQATIATSPFYRAAIEAAGLDYLPVGDSSLEDAVGALRSAGASDDLVERTRRFYESWLRPQLGQALAALSRVAARYDAFISNLKLVLKRGGEVLPGVSVTYDPPLDLSDLPRFGPPRAEILDLVALDQQLIDPEGRWDPRYRFTGFWTDGATPVPALSAELEEFLEAGSAPVVVTLGSMAFAEPKRTLAMVRETLRRAGQRGVIVRGWSRIAELQADREVLIVDEAPYASLFPRASAVVHHGGVGTVAAALRAARASVILPQVACQRVFAELLAQAELSAGSLAPVELSVDRLAPLIDRAVCDERLRHGAERWSVQVRNKNGAERAAELIEAHTENLRRV